MTPRAARKADPTEVFTNPLDEPVPDPPFLAPLFGWRIAIMPLRKPDHLIGSKGAKIFLPDDTVAAGEWLTYVGKIIAMGPLAFRHPKFANMGMTAEMMPKLGEVWLYTPLQPYRMKYGDTKFIVLNDENLIARVPDHVNPWEFKADVV